MTGRKKPGVAFWTTMVVVILLIGYPLSFGPACWIASRIWVGRLLVPYRPIVWALDHDVIEFGLASNYANLLAAEGTGLAHADGPNRVCESRPAALDIAPRTADQLWANAKAWLHQALPSFSGVALRLVAVARLLATVQAAHQV
jgi:hypothetical protein